ncbi:probable transcription factor At1g61730 [Rhododendron vialii]|uniref:probable transcription factor At1g61730 n=1 Tax=Rhododendron vialii TaxID=182163 RepID=UPI00265EA52D|nr:probable transcription factor At1g61730 [Rhododendron vialii]
MAKKKQLFGEDDEITILKGMIGFKSARGVEPGSDMKGFLKFVKKSLRFLGATKTQLYEKMRRLRQKYKNTVMRGEKDGKGHPVFSSAHEAKAFDLSKQIWGNVGGNGVGSGRAKVNASGGEKRKVGGFCGSVGGLSLGEKIVKDGLGLISDSNKVELEGKWKKLRVEETELYSKKLGLICEQMEAVLEGNIAIEIFCSLYFEVFTYLFLHIFSASMPAWSFSVDYILESELSFGLSSTPM